MAIQDLIGRVGQAAIDYAKFVTDNLGKLANWVASGFTSGLNNGNTANYIPPFSGGQCPILYDVTIRQVNTDGSDVTERVFRLQGAIGAPFDEYSVRFDGSQNRNYQYQGFKYNNGTQTFVWRDSFIAGSPAIRPKPNSFSIVSAIPVSGVDNCGSLPPPVGGSPQDNPYPTGGAPVDTDGDLVNGTPSGSGSPPSPPPVPSPFVPAPVPSVSSPPTDPSLAGIGASLDSLFSFLRGLIQLVNSLLELMDRLNKLFSKKEQRLFGLGSVKGDGYLSFRPMVDNGWNPLSLEVFVYKKPVYLSKWFGNRTPHYFNAGLGSVSFVDGSFSVRNGRKEVNYVRSSFDCPQSIGVYYHFGLDEQIEAQISLIMERS